MTLELRGDKYKVAMQDRVQEEGTFKIDPKKSPKTIDLMITSGKDKGKQGRVLRVFPDTGRVLVEHVAMVKKHLRPSQRSKGGIAEQESAIFPKVLRHAMVHVIGREPIHRLDLDS